jgi:hypothetical protein
VDVTPLSYKDDVLGFIVILSAILDLPHRWGVGLLLRPGARLQHYLLGEFLKVAIAFDALGRFILLLGR